MTAHHKLADKVLLQRYLDKYIHAGLPLTLGQYKRLASFLAGLTYEQIAQDEGVTQQAVGQSVRRDLKRIKQFAINNDKHYTNDNQKG